MNKKENYIPQDPEEFEDLDEEKHKILVSKLKKMS